MAHPGQRVPDLPMDAVARAPSPMPGCHRIDRNGLCIKFASKQFLQWLARQPREVRRAERVRQLAREAELAPRWQRVRAPSLPSHRDSDAAWDEWRTANTAWQVNDSALPRFRKPEWMVAPAVDEEPPPPLGYPAEPRPGCTWDDWTEYAETIGFLQQQAETGAAVEEAL